MTDKIPLSYSILLNEYKTFPSLVIFDFLTHITVLTLILMLMLQGIPVGCPVSIILLRHYE
jgi:hypothetical protein